jgi:hypothetical protein
MLLGRPVKQIAYYVNDVREAAVRHSALFGSGPFFALDYPPLPVIYRGKESFLSQSQAVGQWGSVQIELIQDNGKGPSVLHDLYPEGSGRTGIHHMGLLVDSFEAAVTSCKEAGYEEVMRASFPRANFTVVFIDAIATYGHFIEICEPVPAIARYYDIVAKAAVGFDGRDPLREAHIDPNTLELKINH